MKFDELIKQYDQIKKPKWRNYSRKKKNYCQQVSFVLILFTIVILSLFFFHSASPFYLNASFIFTFTGRFVDDNGKSKIVAEGSLGEEDSCLDRYIYVHDLPARFNKEVLKNCKLLNRPSDKSDMCDNIQNFGFGRRIEDIGGGVLSSTWYSTNQFSLEVIFHNRMKKYECLTNDSSTASAIFVPFYVGLDLRRYLWRFNATAKDSSAVALMDWLKRTPEWRRKSGKDHFLVAGRISRDFRRRTDKKMEWGSKFRLLPESANMPMLSIETSKSFENDYAIPYPTYFHPSKHNQISQWQDELRKETKRTHLFSFAGASRANRKGSIREQVIQQCKLASKHNKTCRFLDCKSSTTSQKQKSQQSCDDPITVMKLFRSSTFCLQPPGDSFTRRSIFDSILAGCIPVFFNPGSAYDQYKWHLPTNYTEYSVYISRNEPITGDFSIEQRLLKISEDRVVDLRESVIKLIPKIIYVDPSFRFGEGFEDAFEIAVKNVLEKVKKNIGGR